VIVTSAPRQEGFGSCRQSQWRPWRAWGRRQVGTTADLSRWRVKEVHSSRHIHRTRALSVHLRRLRSEVHSVSAARQAIGPPDTEGRICRLFTRTTSSIKQNVYIFNIPFTVHFVRFNFVDGLGPFQTFSQCLFSFLR